MKLRKTADKLFDKFKAHYGTSDSVRPDLGWVFPLKKSVLSICILKEFPNP